MIARHSDRSCPVAAGAEPGAGNLSPQVDDCKPLWALFASCGRSFSPGTLTSWVPPLLRSPCEPMVWSIPDDSGTQVRLPASPTEIAGVEFRAMARDVRPEAAIRLCTETPYPSVAFVVLLNCVGVQGMCRGGRGGRQAGCLVAKVQVSEGAGARSARSSGRRARGRCLGRAGCISTSTRRPSGGNRQAGKARR